MAGATIVDQMIFPRAKDPTALHQAWLHNAGRELAPHGKRERQRRLKQIAAGSLRIENGLVL